MVRLPSIKGEVLKQVGSQWLPAVVLFLGWEKIWVMGMGMGKGGLCEVAFQMGGGEAGDVRGGGRGRLVVTTF